MNNGTASAHLSNVGADALSGSAARPDLAHVYPVGRDGTFVETLQALADDNVGLVVSRRVDWTGWLAVAAVAAPGCVLLDAATGGVEGIDLVGQLAVIGARHATIVLTDCDRVSAAVAAMRAGAADLLRTPVVPAELARAIREALAGLRRREKQLSDAATARAAVARLSPRERAVMAGLVEGLATDAIAARLSMSVRTVTADRARVMGETGSAGMVDLMRCAVSAGLLVEG